MENRFKEGQKVIAVKDPNTVLIVRRYVDKVYYCQVKGSEGAKDLVYFDRELALPSVDTDSYETKTSGIAEVITNFLRKIKESILEPVRARLFRMFGAT
jgi:hypothetical protein